LEPEVEDSNQDSGWKDAEGLKPSRTDGWGFSKWTSYRSYGRLEEDPTLEKFRGRAKILEAWDKNRGLEAYTNWIASFRFRSIIQRRQYS